MLVPPGCRELERCELDAGLDEIESRIPQMRVAIVETRNKTALNHFKWLVRYQVLGESYIKIAKIDQT